MSNFSRIRAENQFIFLNTGIVFGINSISIQNNFGATPINYIGRGDKQINQSASSAQYADLNISSNLIQEDFLMEQTGLQPFNCFIFQDPTNINTCYSLISGYLNSYSAKYTTNQVPQIQSIMRFYGNAGNISPSNLDSYSYSQITGIASNALSSFNGLIADSNYINLTTNEGIINRVLDFDFSVQLNRLPIFNIGSRIPKRIETIFPINIECNLTFEASDNFIDNVLNDFPLNKIVQSFELDIYSNRTNNLLSSYFFNNMTMISNDRSINSDGNLTYVRKYVGQIFSFANGSGINNQLNMLDFGFVASGINFFLEWGFSNAVATSGLDFGNI